MSIPVGDGPAGRSSDSTSPDSTSIDNEEAHAEANRPRMSRSTIVAMSVATAVLLAVAVWIGLYAARADVRWAEVGFSITDATELEFSYHVYIYTDQPVLCHVEALNGNFGVVGVASTAVDPAAGREQLVVQAITTVERAVSAVVDYCEVP